MRIQLKIPHWSAGASVPVLCNEQSRSSSAMGISEAHRTHTFPPPLNAPLSARAAALPYEASARAGGGAQRLLDGPFGTSVQSRPICRVRPMGAKREQTIGIALQPARPSHVRGAEYEADHCHDAGGCQQRLGAPGPRLSKPRQNDPGRSQDRHDDPAPAGAQEISSALQIGNIERAQGRAITRLTRGVSTQLGRRNDGRDDGQQLA